MNLDLDVDRMNGLLNFCNLNEWEQRFGKIHGGYLLRTAKNFQNVPKLSDRFHYNVA